MTLQSWPPAALPTVPAPTDDFHIVGGSAIHSTATIDPSSTILFGSVIGPGVRIGARCVIGPYAVIGSPGFGYEFDPATQAQTQYRPHPFSVVIHDDVHIGAFTAVDRGRHRDTVIHSFARIDNHVHVAHNVIIGQATLVIAQCMLAGSVTVGSCVTISPGSMVRDHVSIGDGAHIGQGSNVVCDIPAYVLAYGNPARVHRNLQPDEQQGRLFDPTRMEITDDHRTS